MSSLKEKSEALLAKATQASQVDTPSANTPRRKRSHSGASLVAGMGLEEAQRKLREYEEAEKNADLVYVATAQIVESPLARFNRTESYFKSEPYRARKESIRKKGIEESLLLRPLGDGRYELISGHTRLRIARELKIEKVPARIQAYSDTDAALRLVTINEDRTEHTLYDKARLYQGLVDTGLFSDLAQVQQHIGMDKSVFYRLLKILEFPPEIGAAFGGPERIERLQWIRNIQEALASDKKAVLTRAKELANAKAKPEPADVVQQLCAPKSVRSATSAESKKNTYADRQWLKIGGRDVGQITRRGRSFQVSINKITLSDEQQKGLIQVMQQYIAGVLENESSE